MAPRDLIAATLHVMELARKLPPKGFAWRSAGGNNGRPVTYTLDRLGGTDRIRAAVEAGTVHELLAGWEASPGSRRCGRRSCSTDEPRKDC